MVEIVSHIPVLPLIPTQNVTLTRIHSSFVLLIEIQSLKYKVIIVNHKLVILNNSGTGKN